MFAAKNSKISVVINMEKSGYQNINTYLNPDIGASKMIHNYFVSESVELFASKSGFIKQVLDIAGALLGLIIALPVIVILLLAIKFTSKGSVVYSHERIGRFGKPFKIYKFRSMYIGSEDNGPQLSSRYDKRVTPVGRFMRRWRLDEIPNLINVLKGEMSLVGPRPERQFYIDQIIEKAPEYIRLLHYKPGVTSLGEVKFGYAENVDEMIARMKFDLAYIQKITLLKDAVILAQSLVIILKGKGV